MFLEISWVLGPYSSKPHRPFFGSPEEGHSFVPAPPTQEYDPRVG